MTDTFSNNQKEIQLYYKEKGEDEDPYAAFYSHENDQEVKAEWLEQIVRDIDGVDAYYFTNNTSSTISYEKKENGKCRHYRC